MVPKWWALGFDSIVTGRLIYFSNSSSSTINVYPSMVPKWWALGFDSIVTGRLI